MELQELLGVAGKTAIVWGGGGGMGEVTANLLAACGCNVAVADRDAEGAARAAGSIREAGQKSIAITVDVTQEAEVERAVAETCAKLGVPQLSASVVGVAAWKPLLQTSLAHWEHDARINLTPAFLIGRSVANALVAAKQTGSMAFVSSVSGLQGAALHASYGAAKAGLIQLVKTMAVELAEHGIRVNSVSPGAVKTQRIKSSPEMDALLARGKIPMRRFARTDEIARALLFLLSDMASYITGETILVDGGWMAAPLIHPAENTSNPV